MIEGFNLTRLTSLVVVLLLFLLLFPLLVDLTVGLLLLLVVVLVAASAFDGFCASELTERSSSSDDTSLPGGTLGAMSLCFCVAMGP